MPALVTLAEAKMQCRVDTDALDPWFEMAIAGASGAVLTWLKDAWRAYETIDDSNGEPLEDSNGDQFPILDSGGQPTVKPLVKMATLVEIAVQFRFLDGDGTPAVPSHWGHGHVLSAGPTSLLAALRRPTVA